MSIDHPALTAEFRESCLREVQAMLDKISGANGSAFDKLDLASVLFDRLAAFEMEIIPKIPNKAPKLWNNHKHLYGNNPYVFAHEVYKDAAKMMIMSDFKKLDEPLYSAMYRWNRINGKPPKELDIARKFEIGAKINPKEEIVTWTDVLSDAPEHTIRKLRLYRAQQMRLSRAKPKS